MKAKEFFQTVARAEQKLKILKARIQHYEDLGLCSPSGGGAVGGTRNCSSRVEMAAIGLVDSTSALAEEIRKYTAITAHAQRVIDQIPQERYQRILSLRYLCGWSFRSIGDELEYNNPKSVYRAHGWALQKAQAILDKEGDQHG